MKIRLIENGYQSFNGQFGAFNFADGVSVDDVPYLDAINFSALLSVVDDATGEHPSKSLYEHPAVNLSAPVEHNQDGSGVVVAGIPAAAEPAGGYTKEFLEVIADSSGIKGIREVSDPMDVKGTGIADLISKILAVQDARIVAAEAEAALKAEKPGGETAKAE